MKSNEIRIEEMDNTSEPLRPVKIITLLEGLMHELALLTNSW
jgi:hypothetical protein